MCIGLPCQITAINTQLPDTATATVNGVSRQINISLILQPDQPVTSLIGKWVLVHVGFAMNLINEQEARDTIEALKAIEEFEPDVSAFLNIDTHKDHLN